MLIKSIKNTMDTYPQESLKLMIQADKITGFYVKKKHILERFETHLSDVRTSRIESFLTHHPSIPLYVVFESDDVELCTISLKKTKWWERPSLIKQLKLSEFSPHHWVYSQPIPTANDPTRRLLVGLKISQNLQHCMDWIKERGNPIAALHIHAIQQMAEAIQLAAHHYKASQFCPWAIFIRSVSPKEWHLTVTHKGVILLTRHCEFSITEGGRKLTLEKEITATLCYLQRSGYEKGEKVSLLTAGFDEILTETDAFYADIYPLPVQALDQRLLFKSQTFWGWCVSCVHTFLHKEPVYQKSLKPREVLSQIMAYTISTFCLRFLIPLSTVFLSFCCVFYLTSYRYTNESNGFQERIASLQQDIGDQSRLRQAKLFMAYKNQMGVDPLTFLKTLSAALGKESYVTDFSWKSTRVGDRVLPSFQGTLKLDERTQQTLKKNRLFSLATYQEKIQKNVHQAYPDAETTFGASSAKLSFTLGITCP
jgi:hypothetical protein